MTSKIIAHRYGQAFIDYARQSISEDNVIDQAQAVFDLLKECPEFFEFLSGTQITYGEKCQVIDKVLAGFSDSFGIMLRMLLEKQRMDHVYEIFDFVRTIRLRDQVVLDTLVITRFPLDPDSLSHIQQNLENRLQSKLRMREQIDPSFLGGVRVVVGGDVIIDGSVKKRFTDLYRKLRNAKLK
jgi:F-type H+-transporting ATPase subunit delta